MFNDDEENDHEEEEEDDEPYQATKFPRSSGISPSPSAFATKLNQEEILADIDEEEDIADDFTKKQIRKPNSIRATSNSRRSSTKPSKGRKISESEIISFDLANFFTFTAKNEDEEEGSDTGDDDSPLLPAIMLVNLKTTAEDDGEEKSKPQKRKRRPPTDRSVVAVRKRTRGGTKEKRNDKS